MKLVLWEGVSMSAKNKILTILSVLVTICSVFLVVSFLFVGILFLLPDQTKADKQLSTIQSEVQEIPLAIRFSTLIGDNFELNLDEVLENNGYGSDMNECLCSYNGKVYFVFDSYMDGIEDKRIWNVATVNFDGTNFKIEYSDVFNGFYYNESTNKNNVEKCGYFNNGVIVLNDKQKVVEYDIISGKGTEFTFDEYDFFENELDYQIVDNNKITFTKINVDKTLTLEDLKETDGVVSEICNVYDEKIRDKESGLKYFFDSVQVINDKVYLLCRVLNYHGHTSVVVLEYDFETNSCKYVCSEFISDTIGGNYYLIPSKNNN